MVRRSIQQESGGFVMISERTFASDFGGFWAECLPFLTPRTIAELNLTGSPMSDGRREWMKPLVTSGRNSNNDVVAELAFGLFTESLKQGCTIIELSKQPKVLIAIEESAKGRISDLRGRD